MASASIDVVKITAHQAQPKLLRQIVGRVAIMESREEIAMNGAAIALKEDVLGSGHGIGRTVMRLAQDRPAGRYLAGPCVEPVRLHRRILPAESIYFPVVPAFLAISANSFWKSGCDSSATRFLSRFTPASFL